MGVGGANHRGQGLHRVTAPCECAATSFICVSHCQTIKDTVRNVQPHAAVQSSSFAAVACWDTWNCKFIRIQMWREGVLARQTSCIYGILQYFICVVYRFLPVRLSATPWHHPHWDEYRSSSGVAPHTAQAPRICWTWRTSGSPADRTGAPRTPALSSASEGLLKVQERMLKHWQGLISPLVWNIVGEIIRDMSCFPLLTNVGWKYEWLWIGQIQISKWDMISSQKIKYMLRVNNVIFLLWQIGRFPVF